MRSLIYLVVGIFFGIVLFKSEAASWFRIYEMFCRAIRNHYNTINKKK